jgi:uncharacterized protein (DUF58 family)
MNIQELIKKVRKIELKTKGLSNQVFSGGYKTTFKGRGMLFSEVRPYQYGDDVRTIDWNVTARTRVPHIKVFEEERELVFMLLVDVSASAYFGTNQLKNELAAEIAATLAFSAIANNDMVGAIIFSDKIEKFLPPKKGRPHVLRIIRELLAADTKSSRTDLNEAFKYLTRIIQKRCTAFVISDFLAENYDAGAKVAASKHDLIGLHLYDPKEANLPNIGILPVVDAETGDFRWVDTSDEQTRTAHADYHQKTLSYFEETFQRNGADTLSISTQDAYLKKLMGFFKSR